MLNMFVLKFDIYTEKCQKEFYHFKQYRNISFLSESLGFLLVLLCMHIKRNKASFALEKILEYQEF